MFLERNDGLYYYYYNSLNDSICQHVQKKTTDSLLECTFLSQKWNAAYLSHSTKYSMNGLNSLLQSVGVKRYCLTTDHHNGINSGLTDARAEFLARRLVCILVLSQLLQNSA